MQSGKSSQSKKSPQLEAHDGIAIVQDIHDASKLLFPRLSSLHLHGEDKINPAFALLNDMVEKIAFVEEVEKQYSAAERAKERMQKKIEIQQLQDEQRKIAEQKRISEEQKKLAYQETLNRKRLESAEAENKKLNEVESQARALTKAGEASIARAESIEHHENTIQNLQAATTSFTAIQKIIAVNKLKLGYINAENPVLISLLELINAAELQNISILEKLAKHYYDAGNSAEGQKNLNQAMNIAKIAKSNAAQNKFEELQSLRQSYKEKMRKPLELAKDTNPVLAGENVGHNVTIIKENKQVGNELSKVVATKESKQMVKSDKPKEIVKDVGLKKLVSSAESRDIKLALDTVPITKRAEQSQLPVVLESIAILNKSAASDTVTSVGDINKQSSTKNIEQSITSALKNAPVQSSKIKSLANSGINVINDSKILNLIYAVIPKTILIDLHKFSNKMEENTGEKLQITGSIVFKILMLCLGKDKKNASKINANDIDISLKTNLMIIDKARNGKTIDEILANENIGKYKISKGKHKPNPFYANYEVVHEEKNELISMDLNIKFAQYIQCPCLIPSSEQTIIFSNEPSKNNGDISIAIDSDQYLIIENKKDGFFEKCQKNMFALNELPNPEENKVTGYFQRLLRATHKTNGMVFNGLAEKALSYPWQLYYLSRKILQKKGVFICSNEMAALFKHKNDIAHTDFMNLLSNFIKVSIYHAFYHSELLKVANPVKRIEGEKQDDLAQKECNVGNSIADRFAKLVDNHSADNIAKILVSYISMKFPIQEEMETNEILNCFIFAKNHLLQSYRLFTRKMTDDEIENEAATLVARSELSSTDLTDMPMFLPHQGPMDEQNELMHPKQSVSSSVTGKSSLLCEEFEKHPFFNPYFQGFPEQAFAAANGLYQQPPRDSKLQQKMPLNDFDSDLYDDVAVDTEEQFYQGTQEAYQSLNPAASAKLSPLQQFGMHNSTHQNTHFVKSPANGRIQQDDYEIPCQMQGWL